MQKEVECPAERSIQVGKYVIAECISARQLIRVYMSAMPAYVRTWCHDLGMRMSRLGLSNVTFRNAA